MKETIQQISVDTLRPHPRNNEFFDDIPPERWSDFVKSIRTSGVIEPVRITQDNVLVSGHQRVKACKELGIVSVPYTQHTYENDDLVLKDLIETNLQQRGVGNTNPVKFGRCIKELERIYGIQHGNNQYVSSTPKSSESSLTQDELAAQIGISADSLRNYKLLTEMIPELEDLLDTGIVSKSTALSILKNLNESEQRELISSLDITKKITQKEAEKYIAEIQQLKSHPEIVDNINYEEIERLRRLLDQKVKELQTTNKELKDYKDNHREYEEVRRQTTLLSQQKENLGKQIAAVGDLSDFCYGIEKLLKELAPAKYKSFMEMLQSNPVIHNSFQSLIDKVDDWVREMNAMHNTKEEIIDAE